MKWHIRYFLDDTLFDYGIIESDIAPESLAWYCPSCGRVWARAHVEGSTWHMLAAPCERHHPLGVADWGKLPGSLLDASRLWSIEASKMWWAAALDWLPDRVLKREWELAITEVEKHERTQASGAEGTSPRPSRDGEVILHRHSG